MKFLTFIEVKEGKPVGGSLELLTVAASLGAEANALLVGENLDSAAEAVAKLGAAAVFVVDGPAEPTEDFYADIVARCAQENNVNAVLFAATTVGKILTPRVAAKLDAGSVNDATAIELDGDNCKVTRFAFGGTVIEKIKVATPVAVVSVRPGSYEKPVEAAPVAVTKVDASVEAATLKSIIKEYIAEVGETVNLADASVIVSGGRGMGSEEDYKLCADLADVLGGVVGGTRPAMENGWISRSQQVGQSGTIVAPDLYFACGISGATQHMSGMTGSKYVVAINKDEDAPIFEIADVGIVGDVKVVLPLLIEEIKKVKAQ